ncbi:MAG: hypothetical protein HBSIN02_24130 [Bacteroidia bacterium]|nr:MAG: hypothetical protein HBSIN02_24130 [Bacteroidia bacterium]
MMKIGVPTFAGGFYAVVAYRCLMDAKIPEAMLLSLAALALVTSSQRFGKVVWNKKGSRRILLTILAISCLWLGSWSLHTIIDNQSAETDMARELLFTPH